MRVLLLAIVLLVPSSLSAATLTFTQAFSQVYDTHFPAEDDTFEPGFQDGHYFGHVDFWLVPPFDLSLGTPQMLFLELHGFLAVDVALDPPGTAQPALAMLNPSNSFLSFVDEGTIAFTNYALDLSALPHLFPIGLYSGDTFVTYPIASTGDVHVQFTGVAVANYIYEPTATAVPEPISLVLLGSGLAAGYVQRMRPRP